MGDKELEESQIQDKDFEIEIIDLDALPETSEPLPESPRERYRRDYTDETLVSAPVLISLRSKLTRRQRVGQIVASAAVIIVAMVLILNSIVPVRSLLRFAVGPTSGPTSTLAPNVDNFYLDASPPWGNLTLDGHPLTFSTNAPLHLSRGRHQFVWQASPFQPVRCRLSVPIAATDTCTHITIATQVNGAASTAQEVTFYDTLTMLSGAQQAALIQAAQEALDSVRSTTTVQPGEQFVHVIGSSTSHTTDIATQTLHATLHFSLSVGDSGLENAICASHYSSECDSLYRFQSQNVTQNCDWFCTYPDSYTTLTVPNYWEAIVIAHEYWDFTTLDGHTIATNQPDTTHDLSNSAHLLFLNIIWDGSHWQVTFDTLQASGYNTPGCLAANNALNQMPPPVGLNGFGFSASPAAIPADGCLEVVQSTAANPSSSVPSSPPLALCFYRFGIMLAANALAHRYWPSMPLANPYEQALAKRLTAPTT